MLTDDEVAEWDERFRAGFRPLRNLTQQQWRDTAATLRREIRNQKRSSRRPTRVESIEFLIAVNFYREDASAPTPKQQARQFAGVVENLRALIERAYIARPDLTDDLACLNEMFERWKWKAEDARYLVADRKPPSEDQVREAEAAAAAMERLFGHGDPSSNTAPARRPAKHRKRPPMASDHFHQHEFLGAALELWEACGGAPKFSRDKDAGAPTGPLINWLTFACDMVMGDKAPKPETLARFVNRYRKGD